MEDAQGKKGYGLAGLRALWRERVAPLCQRPGMPWLLLAAAALLLAAALTIGVRFATRGVWEVNAARLGRAISALDEGEVVGLGDLTPFSWDSMYVFSPNRENAEIYRAVGYQWEELPPPQGEAVRVVFSQGGEVVCSAVGGPGSLGWELTGLGEAVYAPGAQLRLKARRNPGGMVTLRYISAAADKFCRAAREASSITVTGEESFAGREIELTGSLKEALAGALLGYEAQLEGPAQTVAAVQSLTLKLEGEGQAVWAALYACGDAGSYPNATLAEISLDGRRTWLAYPAKTFVAVRDALQANLVEEKMVLLGDYAPVRLAPPPQGGAGEGPALPAGGMVQCGDLLLLPLRTQKGQAYLQTIDGQTGESLGTQALPEGFVRVEGSGEPGYDYRVFTRGGVEYRSLADPQKSRQYTLPGPVAAALYGGEQNEPAFDVDLSQNLLCWSAADGLYLGGLDGGSPVCVADNETVKNMVRRDNLDALRNPSEPVHLESPRLASGGRQLLAVARCERDLYENLGLYVASLGGNLPGGFLSVFGPYEAEMDYSAGAVLVRQPGQVTRVALDTMQPLEFPFSKREMTTKEGGAFLEVSKAGAQEVLHVYNGWEAAQRREQAREVLRVGGWDLRIADVSENYALCAFTGNEEDGLLVLKYR